MAAEVSDGSAVLRPRPGYARLAGGRGFAEVDRL